MSLLLDTAGLFAQAGTGGTNGSSPFAFAPFIVIAVLFYLLLLRPERRKQAEVAAMLKKLKKNDRVVMVSGIFGTVMQASPESDEVILRIDESNNTRIRVLRNSISRVIGEAESEAAAT